MIHWFIDSLIHWFIDSLIHWFIDSLIHWFIDSLIDWLIDWLRLLILLKRLKDFISIYERFGDFGRLFPVSFIEYLMIYCWFSDQIIDWLIDWLLQVEVDLFELLCKVLDQNLFAQVDWARNSVFFKELKVRNHNIFFEISNFSKTVRNTEHYDRNYKYNVRDIKN